MSAAVYLANLKARRNAIAVELAALTSVKAGGLPNADGDGVNVDHVGYKDGLYRELKELEAMIDKAEDELAAEQGDIGINESQEFA